MRSLDDPVRGQFGCLTAVEPASKEKEAKKEEQKSRCSLNTRIGFRFVGPTFANDDDDDDDATDAGQSDGSNKIGIGSLAGALVGKDIMSSNAKISACEKRRPGTTRYSAAIGTCEKGSDTTSYNVVTSPCEKGNDTTSYNAAISACEKGQISATISTCEQRTDTTSYKAGISPCEKGSDTTSFGAATSAREKGQNTATNIASGSPMTATIKACLGSSLVCWHAPRRHCEEQ